MTQLEIQLIPLKEAVSRDRATTLDLVIRITPPELEEAQARPPLNLGLVLDRSGSMGGKKIQQARLAAIYAVENLQASDRVSVTVYDNKIDTIVPATLAVNKSQIIDAIARVRPGGSTALHGGWVQGGIQVSEFYSSEQLNRVILLSDGLANVGETNPDLIATDVHGLAKRGVSTTTMGIGRDYNEDLMEAMARSGNGNYYYIQSSEQLPNIFDIELQGLIATMGNNVTLKLTGQNGVILTEVLNNLEMNQDGTYRLRDLLFDQPVDIVVRLKVPKLQESTNLFEINLAWDDSKQQGRQEMKAELTLPAVSAAQLEDLPVNSEVQQQVALLMAARAKEEAVAMVDRGDFEAASTLLDETETVMLKQPNMPMMATEAKAISDLKQQLKARDYIHYRKMALHQSYTRHQGHKLNDLYYCYDRGPQQGDITLQNVDAIVNSVGIDFQSHGPLSQVIINAAGAELLNEFQSIGSCGFGQARITSGYNLPARHIIHTAVPAWQPNPERAEQMLARCYRSCLELAVGHHLHTIAFPALGAGLLGFPLDRAAHIAFKITSQFIRKSNAIGTIKFICFDQKTLDAYQKEFDRLAGF